MHRLALRLAALVAAMVIVLPAAPAFGAGPYQPRGGVVLVEGERFAGRDAPLGQLLGHFFALRALPSRREPPGPHWEARDMWRADLDAGDLLVLPGWSGSYTAGVPGGGTREVDTNLTAAELDVLAGWVRDGGRLLVVARAVGRSEQNNLPALLARFGLDYRHDSGRLSEAPLQASGRLGGREYAVLFPPGWAWSVSGGEPVLTAGGWVLGATTAFGRGRVAFLGADGFFAGGQPVAPWQAPTEPLYAMPFADGDNAAFLVDLLTELLGRPPLEAAERARLGWEAKLLALSAAVDPSDAFTGNPRSAAGADFASAHALLAAAEQGRRCDMGPGCVPFAIDAAARAALERAARDTDETLRALDEAEAALDAGDEARVAAAYDRAQERLRRALAAAWPVRERYDPIARARYAAIDPDQFRLLALAGLSVVLVAAVLLAGLAGANFRRRGARGRA